MTPSCFQVVSQDHSDLLNFSLQAGATITIKHKKKNTWHHILEDTDLQCDCHENLKSHKITVSVSCINSQLLVLIPYTIL
jgi:hypothetical protein